MAIDADTVRKIAFLSRLKIDDDKIEDTKDEFNKILNDKNKVKIKEILNDAYNGNDELRKMSRLIEKQYKTTDESKLFFDILGNVILEFKIIGENNE